MHSTTQVCRDIFQDNEEAHGPPRVTEDRGCHTDPRTQNGGLFRKSFPCPQKEKGRQRSRGVDCKSHRTDASVRGCSLCARHKETRSTVRSSDRCVPLAKTRGATSAQRSLKGLLTSVILQNVTLPWLSSAEAPLHSLSITWMRRRTTPASRFPSQQ